MDVKCSILVTMKKVVRAATVRKTGRPLSFDRDRALHQAMQLFWKQGYESTSLADLTRAMGVTAPSVYTAFGDKKRLFLEAVDVYVGKPMTAELMIDEAANALAAARTLLESAAVAYTGKSTPRGCLLANAALACSEDAEDVRLALAAIRLRIETALRKKILAGIARGEIRGDANATALAGLVTAVIQGMSTMARDGAGRKKLQEVAATALDAWPHPR